MGYFSCRSGHLHVTCQVGHSVTSHDVASFRWKCHGVRGALLGAKGFRLYFFFFFFFLCGSTSWASLYFKKKIFFNPFLTRFDFLGTFIQTADVEDLERLFDL